VRAIDVGCFAAWAESTYKARAHVSTSANMRACTASRSPGRDHVWQRSGLLAHWAYCLSWRVPRLGILRDRGSAPTAAAVICSSKGQPQELYDHLTCRKTMVRFTTAEGAGAHCQVGASRLAFARIFACWTKRLLEPIAQRGGRAPLGT
jgi:hypothetical protein